MHKSVQDLQELATHSVPLPAKPPKKKNRGQNQSALTGITSMAFPAMVRQSGHVASGHVARTILDSGASKSMFGYKNSPADIGTNITRTPRITIEGISSEPVHADLKGDVAGIRGALLVKHLPINLVSLNDIVDNEHVVIFTKDAALRAKAKCVDFSTSTILAKKGSLYEHVRLAETKPANPMALLHARCGHAPVGELLRARQNGDIRSKILDGLSTNKLKTLTQRLPLCRACAFAKTPVRSISKSYQDYQPLECPELDVIERVTPTGRGGCVAVLTLLDAASRFLWVRPVRHADAQETAKFITDFVGRARDMGLRLSIVRPDSSPTLCSDTVREAVAHLGGVVEPATPRSRNSISRLDRRQRTLQDVARAILAHGNAPSNEWPHAVTYAAHVMNRMSIKKENLRSSE